MTRYKRYHNTAKPNQAVLQQLYQYTGQHSVYGYWDEHSYVLAVGDWDTIPGPTQTLIDLCIPYTTTEIV